MEIKIKDIGFFKRFFFCSGAFYILLFFTVLEITTFWITEFKWYPFFKINLLLGPLFIILFIQALIINKKYIYKIKIEDKNIELFYHQFYSKKKLSIMLNDLLTDVNEAELFLSKIKTHQFDFISRNKKKKKGIELKLRQFEIYEWKVNLFKKIETEVMKNMQNNFFNKKTINKITI